MGPVAYLELFWAGSVKKKLWDKRRKMYFVVSKILRRKFYNLWCEAGEGVQTVYTRILLKDVFKDMFLFNSMTSIVTVAMYSAHHTFQRNWEKDEGARHCH